MRCRGLNDADLLATDPDGPAEYPTEMTLQKTTFPSSAQLEQLKLKDGLCALCCVGFCPVRGRMPSTVLQELQPPSKDVFATKPMPGTLEFCLEDLPPETSCNFPQIVWTHIGT